MDLTLAINGWLDEDVMFAQQMGASHVLGQVDLAQVISPSWDPHSLAGLRNRIEKAGLNLAGICAVVPSGKRGSQPILQEAEALDPFCRLIEAAGAAGIGLVCPPALMFQPPTRKKLAVSLKRLAETTARAGVKLAIPADRPIADPLASENQDQDYFDTLSSLLESLHNPFMGLDGMPGVLLNLLKEYPSAGLNPSTGSHRQALWDKLFLVTAVYMPLENNLIRRSKPVKAPLDTDVADVVALCWRLKRAGYSGLVRLGQQPHWRGDSQSGHRAQAFGAGYLRAVLQAIQKEV